MLVSHTDTLLYYLIVDIASTELPVYVSIQPYIFGCEQVKSFTREEVVWSTRDISQHAGMSQPSEDNHAVHNQLVTTWTSRKQLCYQSVCAKLQ